MKEEERIFKFLCLLEKSNVSSIIEKKYKKGNRINNKIYKNTQAQLVYKPHSIMNREFSNKTQSFNSNPHFV